MVLLLTSVLAVPVPSRDQADEYASVLSSGWRIEFVDVVGDARYSSIALDNYGYPHISYSDGPNQSLKYAKWTGNQWSIETVDTHAIGCLYTSLALDDSWHPHISYHRSGDFDLMYAKMVDDRWHIEVVDSNGSVGYDTSIALDTESYPHIAYYSGTHNELRYAAWSGNEWFVETVEANLLVSTFNSLALDSSNNPHISYINYAKYTLNYAKRIGAWQLEVVTPAYFSGYYPYTSVAVDSSDHPHISFYDQTGEDLKYASWNGTEWAIETVDTGGPIEGRAGAFSSLVLDSGDHPHISYHDRTGGRLKYAHWNGSGWGIEVVDGPDNVGLWTSIAIDGSDNPHISYSDDRKGAIKYATKADLQPPSRSIFLDIDPDTLNLKSKGRWITAYLSTNASIYDVDLSSILLQEALAPERWDYQDDVLMLKFNRQEFMDTVQVGESVEVKIAGRWEDGTSFEAYDYIRVINPGI